MNTTLTSKGQLTLPKAARDALRLQAGTRFAVQIVDGKLLLTPARVDALSVRGLLKSPHALAPSVEEMDAGIGRAMLEKHGRRPRRAP